MFKHYSTELDTSRRTNVRFMGTCGSADGPDFTPWGAVTTRLWLSQKRDDCGQSEVQLNIVATRAGSRLNRFEHPDRGQTF
jgi:hypothetical protein